MLYWKNRPFIIYKIHGYTPDDKLRLDNFRKECHDAVDNAKLTYLKCIKLRTGLFFVHTKFVPNYIIPSLLNFGLY